MELMRKKVTYNDIKDKIISVATDFFFDRTQRDPLIIPTILVKKD